MLINIPPSIPIAFPTQLPTATAAVDRLMLPGARIRHLQWAPWGIIGPILYQHCTKIVQSLDISSPSSLSSE